MTRTMPYSAPIMAAVSAILASLAAIDPAAGAELSESSDQVVQSQPAAAGAGMKHPAAPEALPGAIQLDETDSKALRNARILVGVGIFMYVVGEAMTIAGAATLVGWQNSRGGDLLSGGTDSLSHATAHCFTLGSSVFFKPLAVGLLLGGTSLQSHVLSSHGIHADQSLWVAGLALFGASLLDHMIGPAVALRKVEADWMSYALLSVSALQTLSVICLIVHEAVLMKKLRQSARYLPLYSYDPSNRSHMISIGWNF